MHSLGCLHQVILLHKAPPKTVRCPGKHFIIKIYYANNDQTWVQEGLFEKLNIDRGEVEELRQRGQGGGAQQIGEGR